MDQIWPVLTAVLAANMLTGMFVYGLYRARHVQDEGIDFVTAVSLLGPLFFIAAGFYLYA